MKLQAIWTFARPQSHYGVHGNLLPSAPFGKTSAPDLSKLVRAAEDAMSKIVYVDDALIVEEHLRKIYGEEPGLRLRVTAL